MGLLVSLCAQLIVNYGTSIWHIGGLADYWIRPVACGSSCGDCQVDQKLINNFYLHLKKLGAFFVLKNIKNHSCQQLIHMTKKDIKMIYFNFVNTTTYSGQNSILTTIGCVVVKKAQCYYDYIGGLATAIHLPA